MGAANRRLVSDRFPYIPAVVVLGESRTTIDALLDTGFDGDLTIPRLLASSAGPPSHYGEFILANGSSVHRPVFLGAIELGSLGSFPIEAVALGGDFLIGRGLSDRFAITLDHGQRVIIEP
jgi:predicted aspartyl protease